MKIIGHRGARGLAPENTIASLQKALEYGVDEVEFDVRVTSDNVAVLHHNSKLKDQSGNKLPIAEHPYEQLKDHSADLVTLQEALNIINGQARLYVEVKGGVRAEPIVRDLKKYKHSFTLASKNQKTLRDLHTQMPKAPKRVIEPWSGLRAVRRAKELDTNLLSMNHHFLWFGFISAMHRRGYELYAYSLNDPRKAQRWAKYGLVGVVTDFPDRFIH